MAFDPVELAKDGWTKTARTPEQYWQLAWDGWVPAGVAPEIPSLDEYIQGYVDSRIWKGTQEAYNAIVTKDDDVLYVVRP